MTRPRKSTAVANARAEARAAWRMSRIWWAQLPIVCGLYIVVSLIYTDDALPVILMLTYIAGVSIIANAVSYATKAKAAEAKAAGYENP